MLPRNSNANMKLKMQMDRTITEFKHITDQPSVSYMAETILVCFKYGWNYFSVRASLTDASKTQRWTTRLKLVTQLRGDID